jgi:Arc/MetJ-type ribon-helix-helix transcriptional regulator
MSKQVTVRLPDELVQFMDERVHCGQAPGRAAVVAAALECERQRLLAQRDAEILAKLDGEPYEDLKDFARICGAYVSRRSRLMHAIHIAQVDTLRPVVVLTRDAVRCHPRGIRAGVNPAGEWR